jgi:CBS domain-containing protein
MTMECPACGFENIAGEETCENCGQDLTELSRPHARTRVDKSLHTEPVRVLQRRPPVIVTADRKVHDVIASLVAHGESCAAVVGPDGNVIGVFSERDLLLKVAGKGDDLLGRPVREFMTTNPVTIEADAPIAYALHQMDIGSYRHLPLVEDGKPVGMIRVLDILTHIANQLYEESDEE